MITVHPHLIKVFNGKELFRIDQVVGVPAVIHPVLLNKVNLQTEHVNQALDIAHGAPEGFMDAIHPQHVAADLDDDLTGQGFGVAGAGRNLGGKKDMKVFRTFQADVIVLPIAEVQQVHVPHARHIEKDGVIILHVGLEGFKAPAER